MISKPKDYFLRVYELFSLLVPGIAFIFLAVYMSEVMNEGGDPTLRDKLIELFGVQYTILLAGLISYIVGHLIAGIGSTVDQNEWRFASDFFEKRNPKNQFLDMLIPIRNEFCELRNSAVRLGQEVFSSENINKKNIRIWARTYLNNHALSDIKLELEYLDAHRRAVRNIAILLLISSLCIGFWVESYQTGRMQINILLVLIFILGWHRHQHIQWKYTELVFLNFITVIRQKAEKKPQDGLSPDGRV